MTARYLANYFNEELSQEVPEWSEKSFRMDRSEEMLLEDLVDFTEFSPNPIGITARIMNFHGAIQQLQKESLKGLFIDD